LQLDVDVGLIFIWVWTKSLIVQYFFICLRQKKAYIMVGLLLTKLTLPETTSEKEASVGAVFVMDSRVSPADDIPKYCLGLTMYWSLAS